MHEFFLFVLFKECIYECMKCDFFLKRTHVKVHEICLNMNFWFCSFWKMHIKKHEIWFFAWCIYECMKFFIEYEFWKYVCMHEIWFFVLCSFFLMVHLWKNEIFFKSEFWIWMKMHVWIHKIWFFCIWIMHLWMQESLIEYEFLVWIIMYVWVHEIWFSFVLRGAFMNA